MLRHQIVQSLKPRSVRMRSGRWYSTTKTSHSPVQTRKLALSATIVTFMLWLSYPKVTHAESHSAQAESDSRSTLPLNTFPLPQHDISSANMQAARAEFAGVVGKENVSDVPGELKSHNSTEWSPSPVNTTASLIVYPKTTQHVSDIMKICHARNIPVTPFSGGTSLDGALAATRGGICTDFGQMNKIIKLRKKDLDVTLQPSIGWEELNEVLAPEGLFFPVDPGPGAQIGGMIATACSGTNAYRYGPMKEWTISLTLVLADGTVVQTRQRPRKSAAGYDLTRLIIGSSGTLALVTEATLKLTALPQNQQVAVVAFQKVQTAVEAVTEMLQTGIQTEAVELLDETAMHASNESGYLEKEYKETPSLFIKFAGSSAAVVARNVAAVKVLMAQHGSVSFEASSDYESMENLWGARKTELWNLIAQKRNESDKFLSCDVAVPISQLSTIIEETNARIKKSGLLGSCLGHVGDGNFHATISYSDAEKEKAEEIILWCRRRGIELEGTVTGEHGIGLTLRDLLTEELGATATDTMRRIKLSLDPKCLLACDKVVRIEKGPEH